MSQQALSAELLSIRNRAEQAVQNIDQVLHNLSAERQSLQEAVKEYGAKRVELLKQELQTRGMTWCTYCSAIVHKNETKFLLVEGAEVHSGGYENSCWGCERFSRLHRACSNCREKAQDQHGTRGRYDSFNNLQAHFNAFHVERRKDGYYARKFGNWVKLDEKECVFDEPSFQLVESLAKEWNLPPRIEMIWDWPWPDYKLIVHEQVAAVKAS